MPGGTDGVWELAVPDGLYDVHVVCGDPTYTDQINSILIEDTLAADPDGGDNFDEYTVQVSVTDGRLTIREDASGSNAKLCFIEVTSLPEGNG